MQKRDTKRVSVYLVIDKHGTDNAAGAHSAKELQGEAPPPPAPQLNSDTKPVEQLSKPLPDSETPSAAVKAEGLMDGSEDPTRI